jgi:hypothetical protein
MRIILEGLYIKITFKCCEKSDVIAKYPGAATSSKGQKEGVMTKI